MKAGKGLSFAWTWRVRVRVGVRLCLDVEVFDVVPCLGRFIEDMNLPARKAIQQRSKAGDLEDTSTQTLTVIGI